MQWEFRQVELGSRGISFGLLSRCRFQRAIDGDGWLSAPKVGQKKWQSSCSTNLARATRFSGFGRRLADSRRLTAEAETLNEMAAEFKEWP